jgi:hypothetical protein
MTIPNENSYRELAWSGVETSFNPQFRAERREDVSVSYQDSLQTITALTLGTHFDVTLDGDSNVTVTPLSMPAASGTLLIERNTRALQETDFQDLEDFPAATYTLLFDRLTMLAAEAHRDITRKVAPFTTINGVVDFRPYTVRAAAPLSDLDLATRGYVLEITGVLALQGYVDAAAASAVASAASAALAAIAKTGAETARDKAQLWSDQAEDTIVQGSEYSAYHWSRKAVAGAAIVLSALNNPDDGIAGDVEIGPIDDGVA